jgi:hypothetical protein
MTEAPNPALQHSTPQQCHLSVLDAEIRYARVNWKRNDLQRWSVRGLLVWCIVSEWLLEVPSPQNHMRLTDIPSRQDVESDFGDSSWS